MTRGLSATGAKNAQATIARVVPALDAYAKAWTQMSVDACEDARVRGTQSMDTLDLRTTCLDRRVKEIRATARVLATADGAVVNRAVKVVDALSPIDGCADLAALRAPTAPPRDPALRVAVDRVRDLVAQAKALVLVGAVRRVRDRRARRRRGSEPYRRGSARGRGAPLGGARRVLSRGGSEGGGRADARRDGRGGGFTSRQIRDRVVDLARPLRRLCPRSP